MTEAERDLLIKVSELATNTETDMEVILALRAATKIALDKVIAEKPSFESSLHRDPDLDQG